MRRRTCIGWRLWHRSFHVGDQLISSGVPPQLLDHMHGYTPGDVEKIKREAEEEAARRRQAMINREAVEGKYEEVVE